MYDSLDARNRNENVDLYPATGYALQLVRIGELGFTDEDVGRANVLCKK
jgi:hypothetical protein